MNVELIPMTEAQFAQWSTQVWKSYRSELIRAGLSESAADENVSNNVAQTMPDGVLAPNNFTFSAVHENSHVGVVWLANRDGEWFIYDIEVFEQFRGQGFGRATMKAIESYVRESGGSEIGLSVFGFNSIAQKLYLSEGYEVVRLSMSKKLI